MNLFSRFFQENQEKFLAFAYSYLRDKAEAEDVVMESMIALWENRDRWEENSNLHALLLTIIKNKALHVLEHKQVRLRAEETISSHNLRELDLRISTLKACEPDQIFNTEIQHIVNKTLQEMPEQSSRKDIYDFMVKELLEAIPGLSKNQDETTYGRFNEWAARCLLANIYLNAEVYTGNPQWEACMEQCNLIIEGGKCVLSPKFRDCFRATGVEN